ncbi:MAG: metallophosphoesterase family protein [Lachnospiraceae bacterium]|nr:metallophosphoesterase family protein [Lachnospiraceae bacterium]
MRRIALISDIHGNYKALEAFLQYITLYPVEGIICLGDYVTDSPYPERTMALLYEMRKNHTCWMLRGNREEYLLNNRDNREGWRPSSANGTLFYTLQHMTERDLAFFASLPTERELCLEGCPTLYLCHGTPGRVRGNVHEEAGLKEKVLKELPYSCLLGGHSHHQEMDSLYGVTYINPGSLGFAVDGVGRRAQFAILTGVLEKWDAEFLSIPYDVESYLQAFGESGVDEMGMTLNKAIKKSLVTGVNYFFRCILAMEKRAKELGLASMPEVPESEWEKLAERFGL